MTGPRPAAFLDRDGGLNIDHGYVYRLDALDVIPGAGEAVRLLNDAGYLVIGVTNQSGVARGFYGEDDVARFNDELSRRLALHGARVDAFYHCPHIAEGGGGGLGFRGAAGRQVRACGGRAGGV